MRKQYIVWTSVLIFYCSVAFNQNLSAYTYHPFSVSDSTVVYFSPGNLQFNAMLDSHRCADGKIKKGTWCFAEHQWDYVANNIYNAFCNSITDDELGRCSHGTVYYNGIECENTKRNEFYEGWIDVFAWATSGYDNTANDPYAIHFEPWEKNTYGYGPSTNMPSNNLTESSKYYDWGQYNNIINDSTKDTAGTWRLLTSEEIDYLIKRRDRYDTLLYRGGIIITQTGIKIYGLILLPDDWVTPKGMHAILGADSIRSINNRYSETEWRKMENNGAVFLPATHAWLPFEDNLDTDWTIESRYWTSTSIGCHAAFVLGSISSFTTTNCFKSLQSLSECHCVRLVCDILPTIYTDTSVTICQSNLPYTWHGHAYTKAGTYHDTLTSSSGCDSVVTLHLTILPAYAQADTAALCYGSQFVWHGKQYTQPGLYADTLASSNGCDSLCYILLTPTQVYFNTIYDTISKGQTYLWNNKTFSQPGLYVYNLPSQTNCDSIITLSLYVKPNSPHTATDNITTNNNETKIEPTTVYAGQDFIVTTPHALVVQIYNATGQLVQLKQVNRGKHACTSPNAPGLYFVKLSTLASPSLTNITKLHVK